MKVFLFRALLVLVVMSAVNVREARPAAATPPDRAMPAPTVCRAQPAGPTTYRYARRPGSSPSMTSLDVYLPHGCGPAPVVLWVHGGGWRVGDKSTGEVVRKAHLVNRLGAALVAVNYRLTRPTNEVHWPDPGNDVAAAVDWVQVHGPQHGLRRDQLTLVGASAGGQLASAVATNPSLLGRAGTTSAEVACVVVLDTNLDFSSRRPRTDPVVDAAFGRAPGTLSDASPTEQVHRNGAPAARFLVFTRGGPARRSAAATFVNAVHHAGGTASLAAATGYTHSEVSTMLGAPGEQLVTGPTSKFLRGCLTH